MGSVPKQQLDSSQGDANKNLRIGMIAPISHHFPPSGYGPWERVCHDLTEGLVELGHRVLVFAPVGSTTSGDLHPTVPTTLEEAAALGLPHDGRVWETHHIGIAIDESVRQRVDVIHSHLHVHALGYASYVPMPLVTTLHGAAWNVNHHLLLSAHSQQPFVSLSDAERAFMPSLNYVSTVHNGIQVDEYPFGRHPDARLAFVGRMAPEKAPHLAIAAAVGAGLPLMLIGPMEARHRGYFETEVEPHLGPTVTYLGPLPKDETWQLVAHCRALIMPLSWEEPFGLVVIESLAVGTPVVGWRRGALPELIYDGVTGFLVDGVPEAIGALDRIGDIDRTRCRAVAENRFSHIAMANGYVEAYRTAMTQFIAARTSETGAVATEIRESEMP